MKQLTKEQAIALIEKEWWNGKTCHDIALFQLEQDRLCCHFSVFHEAVEAALGRPVYTHEFAFSRESMLQELRGERDAPTMDDILSLIPAGKTTIVTISGG